ncbi:MAG: hypothetical protein MCS20_01365 [Candidatus Phytoplasma mali]|nr:hypothetical protein [Candidatus Phytoplasma australiense]MCG7202047.1 hypothetical protein [Candidatus Phytoplasma mali]
MRKFPECFTHAHQISFKSVKPFESYRVTKIHIYIYIYIYISSSSSSSFI